MRRLYLFFIISISFSIHVAFTQETRVKRIVIEGNRHTKEKIIRRELLTRVSESFDEDLLSQDRNRLLNLGIFSDVRMDYVNEDDGAVVYITVKERFSILPFPLLDYSDLDGWSYGGGMVHRNFNGRNRKVGIFGLFGGVTEYAISIYDPWLTGNRISFQVEAARLERDHPYEDFHQTEHYIWTEIGRRWRYKFWGGIKAGFHRIDSDIPGITLTGDKYDLMPFILFSAFYDATDLWVNPSRGWRFTGKLGQYGIPRERPDYRRIYLSAARFMPMRWGRTLGLSVLFAERNGSLPPYERFYIGGAHTLRGLKPNHDRGNRLFIASIEYRIDITKSRPILPKFDFGLGGTLFLDNGTVWSGGEELYNLHCFNGFGVGLRLFLPFVEVFRIDIAWTPDSSYRVHFATGAKF